MFVTPRRCRLWKAASSRSNHYPWTAVPPMPDRSQFRTHRSIPYPAVSARSFLASGRSTGLAFERESHRGVSVPWHPRGIIAFH